jgi:hypothetical protein
MAASSLGLPLERAQLATDLTKEVLHAQQVALGAVEATLGPLLPFAVLEDARRLFDDRPAVLRAGAQDAVDLALADDRVLLAPDP